MNGKVTRAIFDSAGAHCMSPSDDDRYAPSGHRPTNQNIRRQSAGLQKCSMKAGYSLFSLPTLPAARGSWLAARISHSLSCRSSGRDFRAKERLLAVYFEYFFSEWKSVSCFFTMVRLMMVSRKSINGLRHQRLIPTNYKQCHIGCKLRLL